MAFIEETIKTTRLARGFVIKNTAFAVFFRCGSVAGARGRIVVKILNKLQEESML